MGDAYRALTRNEDALEAYTEALELEPGNARLWMKRGDALADGADDDAAFAAFERAARLAPAEFTHLDWNLRGDRYVDDFDYRAAERFYRKSLEVHPNADAWRGLGLVQRRMGRFEEAVESYKRGVALAPDHLQLLNDLGLALREADRRTEAVPWFERVTTLDPDASYGWFNLGLTLHESGEPELARDAYRRGLELDPERADYWIELGVCELEIGEDEERFRSALTSFRRAVDVDQTSLWAWNDGGWVLGKLNERDAAIDWLDHAIELDPGEIIPWRNKVTLLLDHGRVDEADASADQMLRTVRNRADALEIKASVSQRLNRDDEALAFLREAADLSPDDVSIRTNLAEALLVVGDYDACRRTARELLDGADEIAPNVRCILRFLVYATHALAGARSTERQAAFHDFSKGLRDFHAGEAKSQTTWEARPVLRTIRKELSDDEETAFALATAIDLQTGALDASKSSFVAPES
jgi:tetratricopeptide (TPR) repeat protein